MPLQTHSGQTPRSWKTLYYVKELLLFQASPNCWLWVNQINRSYLLKSNQPLCFRILSGGFHTALSWLYITAICATWRTSFRDFPYLLSRSSLRGAQTLGNAVRGQTFGRQSSADSQGCLGLLLSLDRLCSCASPGAAWLMVSAILIWYIGLCLLTKCVDLLFTMSESLFPHQKNGEFNTHLCSQWPGVHLCSFLWSPLFRSSASLWLYSKWLKIHPPIFPTFLNWLIVPTFLHSLSLMPDRGSPVITPSTPVSKASLSFTAENRNFTQVSEH